MSIPASRLRHGAVLIAVLVCLLVVAIISASILANWLQRRQATTHQQHAMQAFWLVESGMQRSVLKLDESTDYTGEVLPIDAQTLGGRYNARVEIRVESIGANTSQRKVTVQVDYPADTPSRVQRQRELTIHLVPGES